MKKIFLTLAATLIAAGTTTANWMEGSTSSLAVAGGEAAIQINLSTEQRLGINLNAMNGGKADAVFSTAVNESNLTLSELPVAVEGNGERNDAFVSVTQFVQTDTGKRFYVFQTGDINGLRIVSYQKGTFTLVFDGSVVEAPGSGILKGDGKLEIGKKDLLLHVDRSALGVNDLIYSLTFDKKSGMFIPVLQ